MCHWVSWWVVGEFILIFLIFFPWNIISLTPGSTCFLCFVLLTTLCNFFRSLRHFFFFAMSLGGGRYLTLHINPTSFWQPLQWFLWRTCCITLPNHNLCLFSQLLTKMSSVSEQDVQCFCEPLRCSLSSGRLPTRVLIIYNTKHLIGETCWEMVQILPTLEASFRAKKGSF